VPFAHLEYPFKDKGLWAFRRLGVACQSMGQPELYITSFYCTYGVFRASGWSKSLGLLNIKGDDVVWQMREWVYS